MEGLFDAVLDGDSQLQGDLGASLDRVIVGHDCDHLTVLEVLARPPGAESSGAQKAVDHLAFDSFDQTSDGVGVRNRGGEGGRVLLRCHRAFPDQFTEFLGVGHGRGLSGARAGRSSRSPVLSSRWGGGTVDRLVAPTKEADDQPDDAGDHGDQDDPAQGDGPGRYRTGGDAARDRIAARARSAGRGRTRAGSRRSGSSTRPSSTTAQRSTQGDDPQEQRHQTKRRVEGEGIDNADAAEQRQDKGPSDSHDSLSPLVSL